MYVSKVLIKQSLYFSTIPYYRIFYLKERLFKFIAFFINYKCEKL